MCYYCGQINDLSLADRHITCISCGRVYSRDLNAARNIEWEELKMISAGAADYGRGATVSRA